MKHLNWLGLLSRPALLPFCALLAGTSVIATDGPTSLFLAASLVLAALPLVLSSRWLSGLALLGGFAMAGMSYATHYLQPPPQLSAKPVEIEGRIEALDTFSGQTRLELSIDRLSGHPTRFLARLYPQGTLPKLIEGQRIRAVARLKLLERPSNPGEFNSFERNRRKGLLVTGGFDAAGILVVSSPNTLTSAVAHARERLTARVLSMSPEQEPAHLYLALAAGRRSQLGELIEDDFAKSGLAHLLSVSGLHVAALGVFARAFFRLAWVYLPIRRLRRWDGRTVALPFSLLAVWGYTVFTGASIPAVRSALMISLLFVGSAFKRRSDALNGLAVAAAVMIAVQPWAIADLSAQLSVLSALGLMVVAPKLRALLPERRYFPRPTSRMAERMLELKETAFVTVCASVAVVVMTAPLIAAAFQRVSLMGVISNVVCLPLCSVSALLAAFGAGVFCISPALSFPILQLGLWSCKALLWVSHFFAQLPLAAIQVPSPSFWTIALWLFAVFALVLASRKTWPIGASLIALSLVLWSWPLLQKPSPFQVTFLAVGHGDAIVLRSLGKTALIDGGGVPGGTDTGKRFVIPYLKTQGVKQLELAVLSHAHPDHALGLTTVLKNVPTHQLWLPAGVAAGPLILGLKESGTPSLEVQVGSDPFQFGEATIEVLGPPADRILLESENDRSVVLKVRHGAVSFLLTGDLEEAGEEVLDVKDVTVMKAPHHGSRTSSSPKLLDRARPKFVVFCVGVRNRFGFPHAEIVDRYQVAGARCYRTDLDGAITFHSDGQNVRVETFKSDGEAWRATRRDAQALANLQEKADSE